VLPFFFHSTHRLPPPPFAFPGDVPQVGKRRKVVGKHQRFFLGSPVTKRALARKRLFGNNIERRQNFRMFEMNRVNDGIGDVQLAGAFNAV